MSGRPGMLINLPPPPSDPTTPSEGGPGTPNSTTTSLSTLSVVAIKDGAAGHRGHGTSSSANTLEAERADRISRLAGLERVATVRSTPSGHLVPGLGPTHQDNAQFREISTVGTASATGSIGGKTTWASESMDYEGDKMSEDPDDGVSSVGGLSDEDKASLVGFGEGAGSTVSGPISTANMRMMATRYGANSPATPRNQQMQSGGSTPMSGIMPTTSGSTDAKMMDGVTFGESALDTSLTTPPPMDQYPSSGRFSGAGAEMAETVMRDRLPETNDPRAMDTPPNNQNLGRFGFERE